MHFYLQDAAFHSGDEHSEEEDEGCDHSYVLKDDIGYVCRVCGVVQRAIETIFDFQYIKVSITFFKNILLVYICIYLFETCYFSLWSDIEM